jgi:ABC-type nickel/cobalt efflux system permease component RcnA
MTKDISVLLITAASLGFFHTLFGPDHYLPFIMMSRARRWTLPRTVGITLLCGLGHVGSSILFGAVGIVLGVSVSRLEFLEGFRGNIAAWMIIVFGFLYFLWGVRSTVLNRPHKHIHFHKNGEKHEHDHVHADDHVHQHEDKGKQSITPWVLFTIFVFGPCEPLIPILMYPAAKASIPGLILVTAVFAGVTILTMLTLVIIVSLGVNSLPLGRLERYMHAIAGAMILLSGIGIVFLGL